MRDADPGPSGAESADDRGSSGPDRGSRARRRGRIHNALHRNPATGIAVKTLVTLIGLVVVLAGLIMLVTPGPGLVALVVGLAVLATEWDWAERLLASARRALARSREKAAAVDPATRRRLLVAWSVGVVAVVAVVAVLVWSFGWPPFVVHLWHWLQHRVGWLPDLPGA